MTPTRQLHTTKFRCSYDTSPSWFFVFKTMENVMKHTYITHEFDYLETSRQGSRIVKIDIILEARMKAFLLSRRHRQWFLGRGE